MNCTKVLLSQPVIEIERGRTIQADATTTITLQGDVVVVRRGDLEWHIAPGYWQFVERRVEPVKGKNNGTQANKR